MGRHTLSSVEFNDTFTLVEYSNGFYLFDGRFK
jgi:hypothetical protein